MPLADFVRIDVASLCPHQLRRSAEHAAAICSRVSQASSITLPIRMSVSSMMVLRRFAARVESEFARHGLVKNPGVRRFG